MASVSCKCNWCQKDVKVEMTVGQYKRYEAWRTTRLGHIQDYLPDLSEDDRELFISGTCKKCWEDIFGKGEDQWM